MKLKFRGMAIYTSIVIISVVWLVPFAYILLTAVKPDYDFYMTGVFSLPSKLEFKNFINAWKLISNYYKNSLFVTLCTLPVLLIISSMAAYSLARLKFRLKGFLVIVFLLGFMVPVHVMILPIYILFKDIKMLGTHVSLILTYIAFNLSFSIYLMRGYFLGIPKELEEAATIDGCSRWRIYTDIILPLGKPVLIISAVLNFLAIWNEFFFALSFIQDNARMTLTIGLQQFVQQWSAKYNQMTAGMVLSIVPVLVIYIVFQRYLVIGMAEGAVKG